MPVVPDERLVLIDIIRPEETADSYQYDDTGLLFDFEFGKPEAQHLAPSAFKSPAKNPLTLPGRHLMSSEHLKSHQEAACHWVATVRPQCHDIHGSLNPSPNLKPPTFNSIWTTSTATTMAANEALTPRVFIVRHGETEWAKIGRQTGKTELDLTTGGMEQIQATANHLVGPQRLLDPNKIARIYVSPRKRTQQTMIALLSEHQDLVDEERGVVVKTDDVAEWDFGEYEGLFLKEIRVGRKSRGLDVGTVWNVWRDGCEGGE